MTAPKNTKARRRWQLNLQCETTSRRRMAANLQQVVDFLQATEEWEQAEVVRCIHTETSNACRSQALLTDKMEMNRKSSQGVLIGAAKCIHLVDEEKGEDPGHLPEEPEPAPGWRVHAVSVALGAVGAGLVLGVAAALGWPQ